MDLTGAVAFQLPSVRWQMQKKSRRCSQWPRRGRRGLGCLRSTSAPTNDPLQGRTTRPRARRSSTRAPPDPPPTPPTPQPSPMPRFPRKSHHPAACPIRSPLAEPMHSPNTAPTKVAGPFPAATEPHQTTQQLQGARGHVLGAAGASEAAEWRQEGRHQHQQSPSRAPPRATFWTPTHPHTGLQAPPEPPATEGSEQARGGRDWGRCWCIFEHVAAAATRARTHGSLWHSLSTAFAISEVLKPLRAPLARGFLAGNMTPPPLISGHSAASAGGAAAM